jgi:hypothetical protein
MRMPPGDHDSRRRTAAVAIARACGGDHIVVEIDVKGGQRPEVLVAAAPERRDVRLPKRLADIDVLAGNPVLRHRPFGEFLQLVGPEDRRVPETAVLTVGPGELDPALMTAIEIAAEQVLEMAQHLLRIGFDHRLDVARGHGDIPGLMGLSASQTP